VSNVEPTRVAMEQLDVVPGDLEHNRALAADRARHAFRAGSHVVVMPELATSGYVLDPELLRALAEPLDGPSLAGLTGVAAEFGGIVVYGFCERSGESLFNSVVAAGGDGPVLHYRKLHLFAAEKAVFEPGDLGLPVAETPFGVLGVCVCYDLRFVEVLRVLSLRGADVVAAPTAWVAGFDTPTAVPGETQHVDSARVQANLDQVAVVAVSQVGGARHDGAATLGGSAAFDARGQLLAGPLSRTEADSDVAVIDIADVRASRVRSETIRPREDRRTDVYGLDYAGRRW
jgi:predicted amidohydrolase